MVEGDRNFRKQIDKRVKELTELEYGTRVRITKGAYSGKTGTVDGVTSQTHISSVKSTSIMYLVLVDGKLEDGVYAYNRTELKVIGANFVCS